MKGISDVIAEILILMIVVALAALGWTWFSGIFTELTDTAETSMTQTVSGMAQSFVIENAYCDTTVPELQFTIRNTGSDDIDDDKVVAYVEGSRLTLGLPGFDITPGLVGDFNSSYDCSLDVGYALEVTIETGLSKMRIIE
jgi:FlaG/FlaF family flagellin (archaellin)